MTLASSSSDPLYSARSFAAVHECPDCGLFSGLGAPVAGTDMRCGRCDKVLRRVRHHSLDSTLAFALAGLSLYMVAVAGPFLRAAAYGRMRVSTVIGGSFQLADEGFWLLASLVLVTTVAMPLIRLAGTLIVLIGVHAPRPSRRMAFLFGWLKHLGPWSMIEIYLLGLLVATPRLEIMFRVSWGEAVFALTGLMIAVIAVDAMLDPETVWERLKSAWAPAPTAVRDGQLIGCDTCHQVNRAHPRDACARCGGMLYDRKPDSLSRSWAFTIAAAILYIPSNIYPVMTITKLGRAHSYTILGGIQELAHLGLWPIAALVFAVSIVIPLFKLAVLGFLLIQTRRKSAAGLPMRTKLYRLIDFIGRWSMLDVFVVSMLAALVRFGAANKVTAEEGIAWFASVVVLTLFAVASFDPRLMWDAATGSRLSTEVPGHE